MNRIRGFREALYEPVAASVWGSETHLHFNHLMAEYAAPNGALTLLCRVFYKDFAPIGAVKRRLTVQRRPQRCRRAIFAVKVTTRIRPVRGGAPYSRLKNGARPFNAEVNFKLERRPGIWLNTRPAYWMVGYSSGQRGQTVNLLAYASTGSNPVPTTTFNLSQ